MTKAGSAEDRYAWGAMLFACGVPDIVGAVRSSRRLHWTEAAARAEAEGWLSERGIAVTWQRVDERLLIGRDTTHIVIIGCMLLPLEDCIRDL